MLNLLGIFVDNAKENVSKALTIMWQGVLAIFIVIGIIILMSIIVPIASPNVGSWYLDMSHPSEVKLKPKLPDKLPDNPEELNEAPPITPPLNDVVAGLCVTV